MEQRQSANVADSGPAALSVSTRAEDELRCLNSVSQSLQHTTDIKQLLAPLFATMQSSMGLQGAIALLDPEEDEITLEVAAGLSATQMERGRYRVGEGVTGRVVASGQAMVIPHTASEPLFLNRTGVADSKVEGRDFAFVCVPIRLDGRVLGAVSGARLSADNDTLEQDLRLLGILASIVAPAVKRWRIEQLRRRSSIAEQNEEESGFRPVDIIGTSKSMREVFEAVDQVRKASATVLVRGESGVGKELIAHAIHVHGGRSDKPFVRVNCAALPTTILHSELFGHEKGAFTGALSQRKGRFELANGGTIFLDEIGDIAPETQVSLLRILQEKEFERVGGSETLAVDVRVITATNRDLEQQIKEGRFREDLYYRLNVFPIRVPPLRERKTDILLLADYFVEKYARKNQKEVRRISTPAIDMMMTYHWPGNVRELENCIERAVLVSNDEVIHGHHLPPTIQTAEASDTQPAGTLEATVHAVEREMIVEALKSSRGRMAAAARALGITERVMGLRIKRYGIDLARLQGMERTVE